MDSASGSPEFGGEEGQAPIVVQAGDLSKRFGRKWAVKGLNFEVRQGEMFGLLGPNGAGKSTTMFMMAGLVRPTSGSIRLFGHPPSDLKNVRSRLGALIETPAFTPYLTGRKNLELLARLNGLKGRDAIDEALDLVDLTEAADRKVGAYSQGMRQRLGLAQAIQHKPDLLILDEPTNGLDPEGGLDMWRLLRRLVETRQTTVIVSSHLLHEIEEHCGRLCVMDQGAAVAQGATANLLADPHPLIEVVFKTVNEARLAAEWLRGCEWAQIVKSPSEDDSQDAAPVIEARIDGGETKNLNQALAKAGFSPVYLSPQRRTLRDFFLDLTRQ
jgi:ABC-2 type transport system ATP-binding protein